MQLVFDIGSDKNRDNLPTTEEIAAIMPEHIRVHDKCSSWRDVMLYYKHHGATGQAL